MKAREVATVLMWALVYAVITAVLSGVLFGWRYESGGIARMMFVPVFMGLFGAWNGFTRVKKRRTADRAAGRVDVPPSSQPTQRVDHDRPGGPP